MSCRDRSSSSSTLRSTMPAFATAWSPVSSNMASTRTAWSAWGRSPREEHLGEYAQIDISLDPFPQNGGAGTWESLHMGVPVIAKLGQTTSGRAAGGILKAIGLDDWVAEDDETYIAIAKRFAADPAALAALRQELPARIAASAAGNGATYTRHVEAAYRQFWREYCAAQAR